MFRSMGAELPALTSFMLTLSRIVTSLGFLIIAPILLFIAVYLFKISYASKSEANYR